MKPKKILVVGSPGAGKTRFSRDLSVATTIPHICLDDFYWDRNWIRRSHRSFLTSLKNIVKQPSWILDGNHHNSFEYRLQYADSVIFLDVATHVAITGVIHRAVSRLHGDRSSLPREIRNDPEYQPKFHFDPAFARKVICFRATIKPQIINQIAIRMRQPEPLTVYHLKRRKEMKIVIDTITASSD